MIFIKPGQKPYSRMERSGIRGLSISIRVPNRNQVRFEKSCFTNSMSGFPADKPKKSAFRDLSAPQGTGRIRTRIGTPSVKRTELSNIGCTKRLNIGTRRLLIRASLSAGSVRAARRSWSTATCVHALRRNAVDLIGQILTAPGAVYFQ